jgi:hypothetical protein
VTNDFNFLEANIFQIGGGCQVGKYQFAPIDRARLYGIRRRRTILSKIV